MRILGIDYGKKRIGFAVGSTDEKIAFPRGVVEGIDRAIPFIEDEVADGVEVVVLGIPIRHSSEEGEMGAEIRAFGAEIKEKFKLPVHFQNEMLTTKAIQKGTVHRDLVDAASAALILQGFLDRSESLKQ